MSSFTTVGGDWTVDDIGENSKYPVIVAWAVDGNWTWRQGAVAFVLGTGEHEPVVEGVIEHAVARDKSTRCGTRDPIVHHYVLAGLVMTKNGPKMLQPKGIGVTVRLKCGVATAVPPLRRFRLPTKKG